jgi:hypothetical protein
VDTQTSILSGQLSLTASGIVWLEQFDLQDREMARTMLADLMLVSHNEFERSLTRLIIDQAKTLNGKVALYATRECNPSLPYFKKSRSPINAVPKGSDLGSEARIAALIRNLCRAKPNKFLNHPTINRMRSTRCRGLFLIDDFIGSGERTSEFISSIWLNPTIRSWHSLHLISIRAIAYSSTTQGRRRVERTMPNPEVCLERDCPTFHDMPWSRSIRQKMVALIDKYGARTSRPGSARGYENAAAAIVFEHGCPDNCPAILWAPKTSTAPWQPLFPKRSVLPPQASAFPDEIRQRNAGLVLVRAGQKRLAMSKSLKKKGPIGPAILMAVALAAKGIRTRTAISYATGLSALDSAKLLDRCVEWGLLTPTLRLTHVGSAELAYAREFTADLKKVPSRGSDSYYPQQLRGPVDG